MSEYALSKPTNISPEEVAKLDEFFGTSFKNMETYLNANVVETTKSEGFWLVPVTDHVPGKPTLPENGEDAFTLNSPGKVTITFEKVKPATVVIRVVLSYEAAKFAAKSLKAFQTTLGPVVNDMLEELRSIKGFNEDVTSYGGVYASFNRPGSGLLFRDLDESNSGVELRLYSDSARRSNNK
jgi:hypothetical protein